MSYKPIFSRDAIRMRDIVSDMQDIPIRKKGLKYTKRDWRWVVSKKKFRIYSMRVGQTVKYKLAFEESSFLWEEISCPGRASWEVADANGYLYFKMLVDGVQRSNILKQKIEKKE